MVSAALRRCRSRTTSASFIGSPEFMFSSYCAARRAHIMRLAPALPLAAAIASSIFLADVNGRRPDISARSTGTRRVMWLRSKSMTSIFTFWSPIVCSSTRNSLPTPWVGYTTYCPVLKSNFLLAIWPYPLTLPFSLTYHALYHKISKKQTLAKKNKEKRPFGRLLSWQAAANRTGASHTGCATADVGAAGRGAMPFTV